MCEIKTKLSQYISNLYSYILKNSTLKDCTFCVSRAAENIDDIRLSLLVGIFSYSVRLGPGASMCAVYVSKHVHVHAQFIGPL